MQTLCVGEACELDLAKLSTQKGTSASYALNFDAQGKYAVIFTMRAKNNVSALAQMPVSVFFNNQLVKTISVAGTQKEWADYEVEQEVFVSLQGYMKLFFGESGLEISRICIQKR